MTIKGLPRRSSSDWREGKIVYRPLPTDDPRGASPITRARTMLKWEPKVSLEQGLVKTIEYFRTKI